MCDPAALAVVDNELTIPTAAWESVPASSYGSRPGPINRLPHLARTQVLGWAPQWNLVAVVVPEQAVAAAVVVVFRPVRQGFR
jgi:hypothetical protein